MARPVANRFAKLNPWSTASRGREPLEKPGEKHTVDWAEAQDIMVTKLAAIGRRGWPDRCFWLAGGRPLLIEFKRQDRDARKLQKHIHQELKDLGYDVETHDNAEDAIASLKAHIEKRKHSSEKKHKEAGGPKRNSAREVGACAIPKARVKVPAR